jgi:predicted DNA-binding transcriptional regulator YafY
MANVVPLPTRTAPPPTTNSAARPTRAPAGLTAAEIAALALSLAHLGTGTQAATAREGLRRLFAAGLAGGAAAPDTGTAAGPDVDDTIVATLTTLTAPLDPACAERARVIATAITARRVLRLRYHDAQGALTDRGVEPVTCLVHRDHWYLVAWCRLREAIRAFRFDRMESIETTGTPAPAHPAERFLPFQRRTP